jgi:hypothetical protein
LADVCLALDEFVRSFLAVFLFSELLSPDISWLLTRKKA